MAEDVAPPRAQPAQDTISSSKAAMKTGIA